ncbi:MAG: GTP cyclohydrolase II [Alphaproteobacteria bacterium]|nr:GTP cyclohydrolase II [Alphaproteobacteria bacterium]
MDQSAKNSKTHAVCLTATAALPTRFGVFKAQSFIGQHARHGGQDVVVFALSMGEVADDCMVRLHSECLTGDVMGSLRCDCGQQLAASLNMIAQEKRGLLLYLLGHEGRGIGLSDKLKAYVLQDQGMNTLQANCALGHAGDERNYDAAIAVLHDFGLKSIRLLTNNPEKIEALELSGIRITARLPLWLEENPHNATYLETKRDLMGHLR